MGYKIGVPSLKLNNTGSRSKHCGSFGGVAYEALEERKGQDIDINPELSHLNIYTGYRSAAELMEYSARHLEELKDASGRRIRSDAVVMCATIFKPPAAYMNALSMEQRHLFFEDCRAFFEPVVGKENIKSTAEHYDEKGAHMHVFWEPMTKDGRLCAKEMHNIKLFGYINEHLPAFLRERGWDIDDADCYDRAQREREELDAEEERYQKRQKQGRSSAAYKLDAEKQRQELQQQNEELHSTNSRLLGEQGALEIQNAMLQDENTLLRESLAESAELKTMAEYQAQVIENDKLIGNIKHTVDAVAEEAQRQGLSWEGVKVLVSIVLDGLADIIQSLRIKINRVKLFERLHGLFERTGDLQEKTLDSVLSNAFARSGATTPGTKRPREKEV